MISCQTQMMDVIKLNRILLEDIKDIIVDDENKIITVNINDNFDILINDNDYKYNFVLNNSTSNILFDVEKNNDLNIDININKSKLVLNIVSFCGVSENINAKIKEEGSSLEICNSQISKNTIKVDINVDHMSSNVSSDIYNCIVTEDNASCNIKVTSKVGKGIKKCKLNQDSKIISNNKTNKNKIEPILLIDEYDVNASHSAFIGKFNEDYLFYLMSRGLSKKDSENILLNAFLIGKLKLSNEEKEKLKSKIYHI